MKKAAAEVIDINTHDNTATYSDSTRSSELQKTISLFMSHQRSDGYWWYALEANETIGAEFIFLMYYLGMVDEEILEGIKNRILDVQRSNGTWAIYHDGPPELSTTIECYWALQIAGISPDAENMVKARQYILEHGGIEKARVFTKIHLAMFGIVPWSACPEMPSCFINFPSWFKFNIYEFSSWARASIVPLLIFMSLKNTTKAPKNIMLEELFCHPPDHRFYSYPSDHDLISWESFFIYSDKALKILDKIPLKPLRKLSINKCAKWTWDHVAKTEDIYPALAYCAFAFKAMGYSNDTPQIKKPFEALKMFQQRYATMDIPALPDEVKDDTKTVPSKLREVGVDPFVKRSEGHKIHQQCCISPLWDTPWMIMALLEAGVPNDDPALLRAGRWLIGKQIRETRGDWSIKNRKAKPGGWAFEFENDYFPDVDDTIEILSVIDRLAIPEDEKKESMQLGIDWLLSMQNDDGGWGAFDKNQKQKLVNRIPFSDHKACLDPSTPDITGRMIEYLSTQGYDRNHPVIKRALQFIWQTQEKFGGWFGRWGVNYLYGTWNVIMGLGALGFDPSDDRISRALNWLESVQRSDGGWSESPVTYDTAKFSTYGVSIPSQTAWALMGLVAGGRIKGKAARRGAEYLLNARNESGGWDEMHHTGTGFQGHFYIRYHGYRHYFPLLALGRYFQAIK
ncbi:MAG: squalene--hopene cyclase [Deltaproteobacteria bacterium]|jgi:squalene-hopene/tetraprenyl-beta-curcumene cyclase|nr:squalene--hopene cyclase [Deltaproteobacteria bacterium]